MKSSFTRISAAFMALALAGQLSLPAAALVPEGRALSGDLSVSETFSDPKLRAWLLSQSNLGGMGADGVLTQEERESVTSLDVSGLGLTSLDGLEAFPNLQTLDCTQNRLTQLDLSGTPALTRLYCAYNQLKQLDLSHTRALQYFNCSFNQLTSLDVSGLDQLISLNCEMNQLTQLDLSGCTALTSLYCRNNLLPTLDLSDNEALEFIETFSNQLTQIDVRHLSKLRFLHIDHNHLTQLDLRGLQNLEGGGFVARNNFVETIWLPNQPGLTVFLDDYAEQDPVEGSDRVKWFLDDAFQVPVTGDLEAQGQVLYSQRIPNQYTIYLSSNGGAGSMNPVSAVWGTPVSLPANTFYRSGYQFQGWSTYGDSTLYPDQAQVRNLAGAKTDGDRVTLYAQWTGNQYTIHLDPNGGEGSAEDLSAVYGQSLTLPEIPFTCADKEFAGWSLQKNGSVYCSDQGQVRNLTTENGATVTLYALWRTPLDTVRKPYLTQLETAFKGYSAAEGEAYRYTAQDWAQLCDVYDQAAAEIAGTSQEEEMAQASDRGIAQMAQILTLSDRVDQVTQGWESAHTDALAFLNSAKLQSSNAQQAEQLAQAALTDLTQQALQSYSPLTQEEDRALVVGAAAARLQPTGASLSTLTQTARWLTDLGDLPLRSMSAVRAEDLDAYQSALASYQALDPERKALLSGSVSTGLDQRCELAGQKRSADQILQQEYESLDLSLYSDQGRLALTQALEQGRQAIRTAVSLDAVLSARTAAWDTMMQVPTRDQETTTPPTGGDEGTGGSGTGGGTGGGSTGGGDLPQQGESVTVTDEKTGATALVTTGTDGLVHAKVTLPSQADRASLSIPCRGDANTVAFLVEADGTRTALPWSVYHDGALTVRLDRSADLVLDKRIAAFSDVPSQSWFAQPVAFVAGREIFSGVGANTFAPGASMTRGMLVTVLYRLQGRPQAPESGVFQDVPQGAWYAQAAAWAYGQGITGGSGGSTFAPEAPITRESLALMLYRFAKLQGLDTQGQPLSDRFSDAQQVSPWALEAMEWACAKGILAGDAQGLLNPGADSTRAEVAAMLARFVTLAVTG